MGFGIKTKIKNSIIDSLKGNAVKAERRNERLQNLGTVPSHCRKQLTPEEQKMFENLWGGGSR